MIGQTISHYRILGKLGTGGMGIVYKAQDLRLERAVALKFLPPNVANNEEQKRRFIQEAKAASALNHINICTVYEIDGTEDGKAFIAMAYYQGETLKEKIERGPVPLKEAINTTMQIARGLESAHRAGVVHRDIKPSNIIITDRGEVKIIDFGLASLIGHTKITLENTTMGTLTYMSPEQVRGEIVDHRTDIWSLGVVLYEMLAGRSPFQAEYGQASVYLILNQEPPSISTPEAHRSPPDGAPMPLTENLRSAVAQKLEQIINNALAKNLNHRYRSMQEMLVDLEWLMKKEEAEPILSIVRNSTATTRTGREVPQGDLSMGSILFIEDEDALLHGMCDAFEHHGYIVKIARDGKTGLQVAEMEQPDLIVLDVMLPGMDGFDVCRHLRKRGVIEFRVKNGTSGLL